MVLLRWPRHYRGIVASLLLLLAAGWLPHHHADHHGDLRHVDEAHGSHGTGSSVESDRLPAGGRLGLPIAAILTVAPPSFVAPIRRVPTVERTIPSHLGHDPPHARGSRAPPLLLA